MKDDSTRFRCGMLLALISAAFAGSALANSGRVDFTIGSVNVTNADGRVQPLAKGTEVKSGDKITSGADGRTQIRFSDGAVTGSVNNVFNLTTRGTGTGTGCVNICSFRAGGFFAGNNASLAGITYSFGNTTLGSDLTGAAALKRQ
jgi:hypothetical protein